MMEIYYKYLFWLLVALGMFAWAMFSDPTVRRDRRRRKQERMAMDFHDRIKGGHPDE